jgi:hypothetical protein
MALTLSETLRPAAVDIDTLQRRHGPILEIVRKLTGAVPNSAQFLEIWPTGFRTMNLLVANLLNLPFLIFYPRARKASIGLAMYSASRAAGCAHCSAHCCSLAIRRGADASQVQQSSTLSGAEATLSAADLAAVNVASALGQIPSTLVAGMIGELRQRFSASDVEWLVLSIALMGFLNKYNDAMGTPLEAGMVEQVKPIISSTGWAPGKHLADTVDRRGGRSVRRSDGLGTKMAILPLLPRVLMRDLSWTRGMPSAWPAVGVYLRDQTGYDFPLLAKLRHGRAIRAIATVIRDNSRTGESRLGLSIKHRAGLMYATLVEDEALARAARAMAVKAGADGDQGISRGSLDRRAETALALAEAASPSPAQVTPDLIARVQADLSPAETIELLTWLSVLQLLHRLEVFYA